MASKRRQFDPEFRAGAVRIVKETGKPSHAPDFFARGVDGRGIVINCRPADRITPRDAAKFEAPRQP